MSIGSTLVLLAVGVAATGQVMLKHGMQLALARATSSGGSLALSAATSPWVLGGLVVFSISAIAWLAALARVPLSIAYPFNALAILAILAASVLLLHEKAKRLDLGRLAAGRIRPDHRRPVPVLAGPAVSRPLDPETGSSRRGDHGFIKEPC